MNRVCTRKTERALVPRVLETDGQFLSGDYKVSCTHTISFAASAVTQRMEVNIRFTLK
jgi:hypothetical protein